VNHPGLFVAGVILLAVGLLLTAGFTALLARLRASLREDSPLWYLGCLAPFAIGGGVIATLVGLFWTVASFSDNLGR
jgi:hypothetical protein